MTDFSRLLNPEQCAAATAPDGPILVLAAAGTGKTRTLVHRVAYLIERGVPADRIMLLTFTNRAAREMLERAQAVSGDAVASIWSGTFHSICARLLRRYGSGLGYKPGFQILDDDDQKKLINDIIKTTVADPKDFPKKDVIAKMISEAVNERREVRDIASRWQTKTAGVDPDAIAAVAEKYEARKRELGAMDFDDLLVNGLKLLKSEKTQRVREMLQEHFLHILVDEYQDTNGLQAEFTDILAGKHRNIMAVGDDFQCIYTWRGAQIENILNFPNRWSGCRVIKLERNYRSVPAVLDVANVVMKDATSQFEKTLRPIRPSNGSLPVLAKVYDSKTQANEILREINAARSEGYNYGDMAVLYRSHYQSIDVQMTLARMRVPFRITSGVGVFEQIHVKDVLAYLRLIVNPSDELSFLRVLCLLPGVGEKSAAKIWDKLGRSFDVDSNECREAVHNLLGAKAKPVWKPIAKCMEIAREHLREEAVGEVIEDFTDLFYEDYLNKEFEEQDAEDRMNDLKELAVQIAGNPGGLEAFLSDVALMTNLDVRKNDPNADKVTLSTIHQAKGMEWPVVLVPWLSESMFPSGKATEEGRMDEERRLFYVVVTRAKDRLYLYSPQMRQTPDGGCFPVDPSVFVKEIPPELVESRRVSAPPPAYGGYGGYGRGGYGGGYGRGSYGGGNRYGGWRRGFTLIEMVVVLVVLAIVTHLAMRELSHVRDHKLVAAAGRQLESIRASVFSYDREGVPTGFLADMGRLVAATGTVGTLSELWQTPAGVRPYGVRPAVGANVVKNLRSNAAFTNATVYVPTGWRGPYLRLPVGKTELLDPWGNPIATKDSAGFERIALTNKTHAVAVSHYGPTALERDRREVSLLPDGGATSKLVVTVVKGMGEAAYSLPQTVAWYGPVDGLITGAVTSVSSYSTPVVFEGLTPGVRILRETFTGSTRSVNVKPGDNLVEIKLP